MVNILEKQYFKKYLHKNCHRWWFCKCAANAQYKDKDGTHDVDAYADEYTLRILGTLEDPYLSSNNRALRYSEAISTVTAVATPFLVAAMSLTTGSLAPVFAKANMVPLGAAGGLGIMGQVAGNMKNAPEDVYFHIIGDNSYWKIEQVPCDGIREWAYKICRWSNEVYKERYEQKRSDNYEFQAYIEQRPPTPY